MSAESATTESTRHPEPAGRPWRLSDEALMRRCDCHTYRASGPGGQKRNVTESAVRLRHRDTGVTVVATESRSQAENRRRALRRLRLALAVALRAPPESLDPGWAPDWIDGAGRFAVNPRDPRFADAVAAVLDRLEATGGRTGDTAAAFGATTSQLIRFLRREPTVWVAANRIRTRHGHPALH